MATPPPYDFNGAAGRLAAVIEGLQARGASASAAAPPPPGGAPPPRGAGASLHFWRGNWRSLLALLTLYSIPTAAVTALFFAERHKRVRRCARAALLLRRRLPHR